MVCSDRLRNPTSDKIVFSLKLILVPFIREIMGNTCFVMSFCLLDLTAQEDFSYNLESTIVFIAITLFP